MSFTRGYTHHLNHKGSFYFPTVSSLLCVCVCILSQTREGETSSKDAFDTGGATNEIITSRLTTCFPFYIFFNCWKQSVWEYHWQQSKKKGNAWDDSTMGHGSYKVQIICCCFLFFLKSSIQFSACMHNKLRMFVLTRRKCARTKNLSSTSKKRLLSSKHREAGLACRRNDFSVSEIKLLESKIKEWKEGW